MRIHDVKVKRVNTVVCGLSEDLSPFCLWYGVLRKQMYSEQRRGVLFR
jgi:hypothetical protein